MQQPTPTMQLSFADGPASGQTLHVPRRTTGPAARLWVIVTDGVAGLTDNGRDSAAVLYRRDLASADGAEYRVAHPLLTPRRETSYGGVDEDVTFERPTP
jgi:hypothetical protein